MLAMRLRRRQNQPAPISAPASKGIDAGSGTVERVAGSTLVLDATVKVLL
jgi:hypothetical protein